MNVEQLLDWLRRHGVTVTVSGGEIKLMPGSRVPAYLVARLEDKKAAVCNYFLAHQDHLGTPETETHGCLPLELWRRMSLPGGGKI